MDVRFNFDAPEIGPRPGKTEVAAAGVPMPEAAMHQDNGLPFWKDDVWLAGQILAVELKPKAKRVQVSANDNFGLGIAALD